MKSKQSLMTALVGIAMIAIPITATAGDHGRHWRSAREVRSFQGTRYMGPPLADGGPVGTRFMGPPVSGAECAFPRHDNGNHYGWYKHHGWEGQRGYGNSNAGYVCDHDGDDCRPAENGNRSSGYGYAPAVPAYAVPVSYQAPYNGGGYGMPLANQYVGGYGTDLRSAKAQAQAQLQAAMQTRNAGAVRAARKNLYAIDRQIARTNVRTLGVPYASYGANGSQPPLHQRLLNGLLGGNAYNAAPAYNNGLAYNNNNYNTMPGVAAYQNYGAAPAAGSPYGGGMTSMLAPLLQNYIP